MTQVRAIIFDKDGTLFDFSRTWEAWAATFLQRLTSDPDQAQSIGKAIGFNVAAQRFNADSVVIAGTPMEVAQALADALPHLPFEDVVRLINEEAERAPQVEAVPLLPLLTELLAQDVRLAVVTNDAEASAHAHLLAAGVSSHFDFVAGCDSGFGAKPEPGQLVACVESFGLSPSEVLMVGDSTHDLIAANALGMRSVGVLTGMAEHVTLAPLATAVLPDIGHLPAWLAGTTKP